MNELKAKITTDSSGSIIFELNEVDADDAIDIELKGLKVSESGKSIKALTSTDLLIRSIRRQIGRITKSKAEARDRQERFEQNQLRFRGR